MQRREFNKALVGGALGTGLTAPIDRQPASAQAQSSERLTPRKNTLMHVGADVTGEDWDKLPTDYRGLGDPR